MWSEDLEMGKPRKVHKLRTRKGKKMNDDDFNLYSANFEELWNKLQEVVEQEDDNGVPIKQKKNVKDKIQTIRYGDAIRIPWYVFYEYNDYTEEYPYSKSIKVKGFKKYNLTAYNLERDHRMTLMRSIIKEYGTDQPVTTPREGGED